MKLLNLTLISHKNSNSLRIEEEPWVECLVSIISQTSNWPSPGEGQLLL